MSDAQVADVKCILWNSFGERSPVSFIADFENCYVVKMQFFYMAAQHFVRKMRSLNTIV